MDRKMNGSLWRGALGAIAGTAIVAGCAFAGGKPEDRALAFPAEYKSWDNYIITDRLGNEQQVMSIYGNSIAREGGGTADGSVLVGEVYQVKTDADGAPVESALGRRIPTELKAIVVMERRAGWAGQYPDDLKVGGWEFEVFSPAGENLNKDTTACRECHAPLGDSEFIFSYDHLRAAN